MFFNEDCPLRMDKEAVNRAQLKTHRKPTMSRVDSEPNDTMCVRKNVQICRTCWKCPPNFAMNSDWGVAAADESQELKAQNYREARVLEEIYQCPSAIPLNPSVATDAYDGHLDDALVPTIPLIPIEEEEEEGAYIAEPSEASMAAPPEASVAALPEASMAAPPEASMAAPPEASMAAPSEASMELQALHLPQATLEPERRDTPLNDLPASLELPANVKPNITTKPGVEADAAAAAAAAYTAILKCKEQGSLIDSDLLISILSNPELIKKLIVEHGFSEDVLMEPATMLKDVSPPTLDRGSKKSCDVGEPYHSYAGPLSRPKMVTGTTRPSLPADHVGVAPFSWTPSAPFRRSTSDEMMINDLINKLSGSSYTEVKPVVLSTSLLTSKPDFLECRRLISQFGYDKQGEPVVVSPLSTREPGIGPSLRPDIPESCLHLAPQSVHQNAPSMAISAGAGPSPRPQISNSNVAPMAVTSGTGLPLKPHFPNSSFELGPVQNACPNGPSMAITAGTGPSPRPQIPDSSLHMVPMAVTSGTGLPPKPHFPNSSFELGPVQNACPNGPSMAMTAGTGPSPRPQIPDSSLHMVPMAVTSVTGPSPRPHFQNFSLKLGPVQNACSNVPLMAMTTATGPSPRSDIPKSSFPCVPPQSVRPNASVEMAAQAGTSSRPNISSLLTVPHNIPQGAPSMVVGTNPSARPHFPNFSVQLGPVQNACLNGPSMAVTAGTGPSLRPDIPKCAPSVAMAAPSMAMAARTGTHNVYQGAPSVVITAPSTKNMEYFKNLIRSHGNEQETLKVAHVDASKSHNYQQCPLTSIGQEPMFEKSHCKYFSMPRGCRNGVNCQFKHVAENLPNAGRLLQEAPGSKRVKFCGEFGTKK